jgi:hypothetical protein
VHLNVNRTWGELRQLMCEGSSGPSYVDLGWSDAQEADEWIRTSVLILEESWGRRSKEVMGLRSLNERFGPFVHTA